MEVKIQITEFIQKFSLPFGVPKKIVKDLSEETMYGNVVYDKVMHVKNVMNLLETPKIQTMNVNRIKLKLQRCFEKKPSPVQDVPH